MPTKRRKNRVEKKKSKPWIEPKTFGITRQVLYQLTYENDSQLSISHSHMLVKVKLQHKMKESNMNIQTCTATYEAQINLASVNACIIITDFSINFQQRKEILCGKLIEKLNLCTEI